MKISKLKNNPNNPRLIKDDKFKKLVESIRTFPEMMEKRPIVCVTDVDGKLYPLGGNMRLKALQELKYKEIPDSWVLMADEWTEEQRREFIIKDNIGFGEWNWEELANEWDSEKLEEWGLDLPGFGEAEETNGGSDPFDDEGIEGKNQYGVIVICGNESEQEAVFEKLSRDGYTCKIVVT